MSNISLDNYRTAIRRNPNASRFIIGKTSKGKAELQPASLGEARGSLEGHSLERIRENRNVVEHFALLLVGQYGRSITKDPVYQAMVTHSVPGNDRATKPLSAHVIRQIFDKTNEFDEAKEPYVKQIKSRETVRREEEEELLRQGLRGQVEQGKELKEKALEIRDQVFPEGMGTWGEVDEDESAFFADIDRLIESGRDTSGKIEDKNNPFTTENLGKLKKRYKEDSGYRDYINNVVAKPNPFDDLDSRELKSSSGSKESAETDKVVTLMPEAGENDSGIFAQPSRKGY